MRIDKIKYNHRPRLLIIFCGWSVSPEILRDIKSDEGEDLWLVSDDTPDKLVVRGLCGLAYLPGMARKVRHLHRHQWHTPPDR